MNLLKLLMRLVITSILVLLLANFLDNVHVDSIYTAIVVAIVLGLLQLFVKPIMILLTLPLTIISFGLFLIVINIAIIFICARVVDGFSVDTWFSAFLFSAILSFSQSFFMAILDLKN